MHALINIQDDIIRLANAKVLDRLLIDKSTGKNIMWGTDAYTDNGKAFERREEIKPHLITGSNIGLIKTRARKAFEQQSARTKQHAEVFTPLWVCKKMIDHADEVWFGRAGAFDNTEEKVVIPKRKKWQHYVDQRRLEISCGEAPFLVSRYDVASAEIIPIEKRIGILDRKLRIVNENTETEEEWIKWAFRAFEATYGYEFQGDNLLIARVNFMMSFVEYLEQRWHREPTEKEYQMLANRISWNLWQMDGLSGTIPYCQAEEEFPQFDLFGDMGIELDCPEQQPLCKIYDWRRENSLAYKNVNTGGRNMKFDFIIGNPPYQESQETNNKAEAIYHYFYDSVVKIADRYMLISPARFLFNAGLTPKAWNKKMLSDQHLKVVEYFANSLVLFPNTNITGGVVIIYRDAKKVFGAIEHFVPDDILRKLSHRFPKDEEKNMSSIMYGGRSDLKFNDLFLHEFPDTKDQILKSLQKKHPEIKTLGPNEEYEIKSSSFERTPYAFIDTEPKDKENYYKILGIENGKRIYKWIKRKYLSPRYPDHNNIECYKIFIAKADGAAGTIGKPVPARVLGKPVIAEPGVSSFPSFISIGNFNTKQEACHAEKYIKTKFARTLFGILKVTQDVTPSKWSHVPLQDFTSESDIDWSKSIPEIDKQLYAKYGLSQEEIDFIETHVKEMS